MLRGGTMGIGLLRWPIGQALPITPQLNQTRIAELAKMFIEPEKEGYNIAKDLDSDYVVPYLVGQRFPGANGTSFYALGSGGDESKKQWFIRIGGFNEMDYLEEDGFTPTPKFWNDTLLGKMIPFTPQAYASIQGGQLAGIQPVYQPGTIALYTQDLKFPLSEQPDQPFSLVYASPSLYLIRRALSLVYWFIRLIRTISLNQCQLRIEIEQYQYS